MFTSQRIEQFFCKTAYGNVGYWVTTSLPRGKTEFSSSPLKLVLFIHGVGGSGRYWFSYLERLAAQSSSNVVALALDLIGFGASAKPEIEYTLELHLSVVEAVLEDCRSRYHLKLVELEVVGHSMGGIIALHLATRPGLAGKFQVTKLVLLGTPCATYQHDLRREVLRSPLNRAMLGRKLICQSVHHTLKFFWPVVLFLVQKGRVKTPLPLPVVADYMKHTCQSYTSSARHLIFEPNLDKVLAQLQPLPVQVLLVYSREDGEIPLQHGEELARRLEEQARFEVLEQGGHQLLGEKALLSVTGFLL